MWIFLWLSLSLTTPVAGADWQINGAPQQGAVLFGRTAPGAVVTLDGQSVQVSEAGRFVLGFGRDAPTTAVVEATLPSGERLRQELKVAQREYDIQRIDGLPPAQVTPPPEVLERIANDNAQVRRARARRDQRDDFSGGFIWPAEGRISGVYGSQRVLNGQPRRPHYGIDVAAPTGTPVVAPAPGVVTLAHPDMYYSGGTMIIDHGHGLSSTFLHLSQMHVAVGDVVAQGDLVGDIGATGRVTGPHLDWRMNWHGARVDPELLVPCRRESQGDCPN